MGGHNRPGSCLGQVSTAPARKETAVAFAVRYPFDVAPFDFAHALRQDPEVLEGPSRTAHHERSIDHARDPCPVHLEVPMGDRREELRYGQGVQFKHCH